MTFQNKCDRFHAKISLHSFSGCYFVVNGQFSNHMMHPNRPRCLSHTLSENWMCIHLLFTVHCLHCIVLGYVYGNTRFTNVHYVQCTAKMCVIVFADANESRHSNTTNSNRNSKSKICENHSLCRWCCCCFYYLLLLSFFFSAARQFLFFCFSIRIRSVLVEPQTRVVDIYGNVIKLWRVYWNTRHESERKITRATIKHPINTRHINGQHCHFQSKSEISK